MSDLIVFTYPTEVEAGQALAHVSSQEQQNVHKPLVAIEDAAVAIKKDNGKVKIRQTLESTAKGSRTIYGCLLYTSPSPRDRTRSRMPSSA